MIRTLHARMRAGGWLGLLLACAWLAPKPCAADFYGDIRTKRYHTEDCPEKKDLKARYRKVFTSEEEAGSRGFYPCTTCIPPAGQAFGNQRLQVKHSQPVVRNAHYVGDKQNRLYHHQWCAAAKALAPADQVKFQNVEAAVRAGYERCPECRPPVPMVKMQVVPEEPAAGRATPVPQNSGPAAQPKPTPAHAQDIEDVIPGTNM